MIYISEFFGDIPGIFLHYFQNILYFLYVCQSVSQSLISLPIGHFWGSTSETSGLVVSEIVQGGIKYNLERFIFEAIEIEDARNDPQIITMNSRSEWGGRGLPRIQVTHN